MEEMKEKMVREKIVEEQMVQGQMVDGQIVQEHIVAYGKEHMSWKKLCTANGYNN
jgi:hypothetical protein